METCMEHIDTSTTVWSQWNG